MITILIVDDEKLERRGIRFLLKREEGEFQILEATNGKDALGVLESNHVDILFSDVKMPYMNGLELTKAVREDHPDMEIVIFSGYNDFSYAREALRYGVVDYVLKPVDPEEFHKTFQRVMENISSKIEKKEQQEKKEDYLKKYFLLKYLYEGKEEDFVQFKKLTDGMEDMGLENEVELLAARVHGSRSREELYRDDSDLDVVLSYRGNIREDSFFNELNARGIVMAGIKVDINPIAEERITLAEYMKESEAYLDQQEIKKLAVDLDNFSYEYDTYEYKDTVENREEQVEKITEDILNQKTGCLKDWLIEVSEESDIDSDVITARSLLSRLEDAERFSIFDKQPEQEQPEATISFYVAECMEFPVMGEYHNNLTLEEAIKIYESIPAERLHGIKGIGFDLQDGDEDYSGEYGLMSGDRIDRDLIDMIPHYKESPLVQKAINDMEKYLNEKHGKVQEAEQTVEVKQEVPEAPVKKESVSVEPNREQNKEPAKGGKGELKKSVLQSLKEFQVRAKAQEQKETATEKSKARKKGEVEL